MLTVTQDMASLPEQEPQTKRPEAARFAMVGHVVKEWSGQVRSGADIVQLLYASMLTLEPSRKQEIQAVFVRLKSSPPDEVKRILIDGLGKDLVVNAWTEAVRRMKGQ
jgi:hypothetical protein